MNKFLYGLFAAAAFSLSGCDYNEEHFPGFDDNPLEEVVQYEADFSGAYPKHGYFIVEKNGSDYLLASSDAAAFQASVNGQMAKDYPYADKGSTAKLSNMMVGEIIKGFFKPTEEYTLQKADYDAMGEEKDQPGERDNFSEKMDVDSYLIPFCSQKYPDAGVGTTVAIIYKYYSKGLSTRSTVYEKTADSWKATDYQVYLFARNWNLTEEEYKSMGTDKDQPGSHNNFSEKIDPAFYLPIFLKLNYPYAKEGDVYKIGYKFYNSDKETEERSAIYRYCKGTWAEYDPYVDEAVIFTMKAELTFDGTNWVLDRLIGNSVQLIFGQTDYEALYNWSKENKREYLGTKYPDQEEYWFGVSTYYPNVNNNYSTWKKYYDKEGIYASMSDEELQALMDERLAWGISNLILPAHVSEPDEEMAYVVTYAVFGGRGKGDYSMSFKYDSAKKEYVWIAGPVAVQ